eukprot:TRINITY_DN18922_c0_g1_i1.p1 TRINITY_DN18922_c0_g1~~TRINITY_DN18922_c0_g1_i1.p1  ORF type:complete len:291 (-),score=64.74 TRINITY_DN18922_c0_g1_i1:25-897(-)
MQGEKNIKILLFDLDNTLYPSSSGMMNEMDARMYSWITEKVKMDEEMIPEWEKQLVADENKLNSFRSLSKLSEKLGFVYWIKYGLSVNGLRLHHWNELSEEEREKLTLDYLDYVHDVSRNLPKYMKKDGELKTILQSLRVKNSEELQKWIFTNSYADHANRILEYLDIKELFHGMIDYLIMRNDCKPLPSSYNLTLKMINQQFNQNKHQNEDVANPSEEVFVLPQNCIFFDDSLSNLRAAKALGFYTIWIGQDEKKPKPDSVDFAFLDIVSCLKNPEFLNFFNLTITEAQ